MLALAKNCVFWLGLSLGLFHVTSCFLVVHAVFGFLIPCVFQSAPSIACSGVSNCAVAMPVFSSPVAFRFCRLIVFALSSHVPQVKSCCVEFCTSVCLWLWILFLDVIYLAFFINSTCFVCLACLFFGIWIPDFACNPASPSWFPAFRTSTMHIHDTNLGLQQGTDFETLTKD